MTKINKEAEARIANEINEICTEILEYSNNDYHFNVIVTSTGEVIRGDLHINGNSWTEFKASDIVARFNIYACDIKQMIANDGNDPDDEQEIEIYENENRLAYKKFAGEMARAIVNGEPTEEIHPEIVW